MDDRTVNHKAVLKARVNSTNYKYHCTVVHAFSTPIFFSIIHNT